MSDISILAFFVAMLLFIVGAVIFVRYFPWKRPEPLYLTIIIDSNDYKTYDAFMQILKNYDLMDAQYEENTDVIRMIIAVEKEDYESFYKSIRTLQNAEVI